MSREQRQRRELFELCETGALVRAIDLASLHFADFGRSEEVLDALGAAIERTAVPAAVLRRFEQLRFPVHGRSVPGQPPVSDWAQRHHTHHEQGDHR